MPLADTPGSESRPPARRERNVGRTVPLEGGVPSWATDTSRIGTREATNGRRWRRSASCSHATGRWLVMVTERDEQAEPWAEESKGGGWPLSAAVARRRACLLDGFAPPRREAPSRAVVHCGAASSVGAGERPASLRRLRFRLLPAAG